MTYRSLNGQMERRQDILGQTRGANHYREVVCCYSGQLYVRAETGHYSDGQHVRLSITGDGLVADQWEF